MTTGAPMAEAPDISEVWSRTVRALRPRSAGTPSATLLFGGRGTDPLTASGREVRRMREGSSTEASGMGMGAHSNRQAALSAGVLFITATVANVIGTGLSRSLLDGSGLPRAVSAPREPRGRGSPARARGRRRLGRHRHLAVSGIEGVGRESGPRIRRVQDGRGRHVHARRGEPAVVARTQPAVHHGGGRRSGVVPSRRRCIARCARGGRARRGVRVLRGVLALLLPVLSCLASFLDGCRVGASVPSSC